MFRPNRFHVAHYAGQVLKARSRTLNALTSSPKPILSPGISFGPSDFLVPPGLRLHERSVLSLVAWPFSTVEDPFINEPILGMVLAPLAAVGVVFELSCLGGNGDGDLELVEC